MTARFERETWTIAPVPAQPRPVAITGGGDASTFAEPDLYMLFNVAAFFGPPVPAKLTGASIAALDDRSWGGDWGIGYVDDIGGWNALTDEYVVYSTVDPDGSVGIYALVMWAIDPSAPADHAACTAVLYPNVDDRYAGSVHPFQSVVATPCAPSAATVADRDATPEPCAAPACARRSRKTPMRILLTVLLTSLCAACATHDDIAKGGNYQPPGYRTGSNLPTKGSTRSPDATSISGDDLRMSMPPVTMMLSQGGHNN
jgi:hypothetical protein